MLRVLIVMALLGGLAAYAWRQQDDAPPAAASRATEASPPAEAPHPPVSVVAEPATNESVDRGLAQARPGKLVNAGPYYPALASDRVRRARAADFPSVASVDRSIAERSTTLASTPKPRNRVPSDVRQTAFFETSEELPPGTDYPEGPQLLRTADAAAHDLDAAAIDAARPPAEPAALTTVAAKELAAPEADFTPLFSGHDLSGWEVHEGKSEAWSAAGGVLRCSKSNGGWLRTAREYGDFDLRLDVKLSAGANTGIGFRFPAAGSPTLTGFEIQLIDDTAEKYADLRPDQHSGSIYYQIPPLEQRPLPTGTWVPVEVQVRGPRIQVQVEGAAVNDIYLDQLPAGEHPHPLMGRPLVGFVGLQSSTSPVEFRNIRIRDLGTHFDSGLTTIDLTVGTGDVCPAGARVTVEYCGSFTDGRQFDSSYERGKPLTVNLDDVIEGWQAGIPGMRVGGRRKLVVPAAMAYGDAGVKDLVPPGATLVFEVELRGVER